ncbi:MAG: carboxylating nicotinate-nucleotide diphosphorylase [Alphaproteobacteria bacterium]|nr:carboxylating nicotinate-nucleotide diphosphorylase [Alphaproteobacteria bacterium]
MLKLRMPDPKLIEPIIRAALAEDLGTPPRDITSESTIPADMQTRAVMRARKPGVIAGLRGAEMAFRLVDPSLQIELFVKDGDKVTNNDIMVISGNARSVLAAERTALNFLSHLSGIATLTRKYCDIVAKYNTKILDTRKTLPGWRELHKYAVRMGGGHNHRMGLYDAVLIKDNHISVSKSIKVAIDKARAATGPSATLEIEVDTIDQLRQVLDHSGVNVVLFDNMDLPTLRQAVTLTAGRLITEASGGITLENISDIAATGVNRISIGALTHSAPALDIGLDIDL